METVILRGTNEGKEVQMDGRVYVRLSDGVYEKSDKAFVVRIEGKYYRKNSPLIQQLDEGEYGKEVFVPVDLAIQDYRGRFIHTRDSFYFESISDFKDGFPVLSRKVAFHSQRLASVKFYDKNGQQWRSYGENEEELLRENGFVRGVSNTVFFKKDLAIKLSDIYGDNKYLYSPEKSLDYWIKEGVLLKIGDEIYISSSIEWSYDLKGNRYKPISVNYGGRSVVIDKRAHPFHQVQDISGLVAHVENFFSSYNESDPLTKKRELARSTINHITYFKPTIRDVDSDFAVDSYPTEMGIICRTKEEANLLGRFYEVAVNLMASYNAKTKKLLNSSWFKNNHEESYPELWSNQLIEDTGGDHVFFKGKPKTVSLSGSKNMTGGIGYTFGVELETSNGMLPRTIVSQLGLDAVGDRSIGALEYVTEPLHGDLGLRKLMRQASVLGKYCTVDDRCGVHIHVGGAEGAETPVFNRLFSVRAIMLGCQIEKDLFGLLPDNRMSRTASNGLSYCGSILDFSNTSIKNGRERLSSFVLGHPDGFRPEEFKEGAPVPEFRDSLNRWVSTRYKWLNLVNCNTSNDGRRNGGGFRTIEFRAFNGTLNPIDLRAFLLISLSFVKFIETHPDRIDAGGVTLVSMVQSVLSGEPLNFILNWMERRRSLILSVREEYKKESKTKTLEF